MSFFVEIISPEGKLYSAEVKSATVPSTTGQLTILSHHIPLFTPLKSGQVKVITLQNQKKTFALGKGLMEVSKDRVVLLIETPEYTQEAARKKADQAQKEAEKIKDEKPKKELITPKQEVRRSLIDLGKIKKKRRTPTSPESSF